MQKRASDHRDIGQRKQRDELSGVLCKTAVEHFGVSKLAIDNSERMLHIGLELFRLLGQLTPRRLFLRTALTRAHRHVPQHARCLGSLAGLNGGRLVLATGARGVISASNSAQGMTRSHLFKQDLLVRAPGAQIKAKVFLFHAINNRNLRAPVELIGGEF